MKSWGRDSAVIASFSLDASIDPCATFKRESGNWRIDQAAWGHPRFCRATGWHFWTQSNAAAVYLWSERERGERGDRRGGDNYLEVYGESIAICYVPIKNKDPTIFFCTNRLWKHKFKIKPLESSLSRGLNKHQSSVILLDIFLQTIY